MCMCDYLFVTTALICFLNLSNDFSSQKERWKTTEKENKSPERDKEQKLGGKGNTECLQVIFGLCIDEHEMFYNKCMLTIFTYSYNLLRILQQKLF